MNTIKEINPKEQKLNLMNMIGDQWMLVTAGDAKGYNTMAISCGHLSWGANPPTTIVIIRPQRYTKELWTARDFTP